MTHKAIVDAYDVAFESNPFVTQVKLDWVNELEATIHYMVKKPVSFQTLTGVDGEDEYSLSAGTPFDSIEAVYVEGMQYPRIDVTLHNTTGYFNAGTDKIGFYPAMDGSENIRVAHSTARTASTTANYNTTDTLVASPFDAMYLTFLQAKGEFMLRQWASYNNFADHFNQQFVEYVRWWNERNPFSRRDTKCYRLPVIQSEDQQSTKTK